MNYPAFLVRFGKNEKLNFLHPALAQPSNKWGYFPVSARASLYNSKYAICLLFIKLNTIFVLGLFLMFNMGKRWVLTLILSEIVSKLPQNI